MATAPRLGFNPARKVGSGPDNKAVMEYNIASGYATALGAGDPVKFSNGTLVRATNGANALGVFMGCHYFNDAVKRIIDAPYWPASQTSTLPITALILDDPMATFNVVGNGTVAQVVPGNIYAMDLTAPDANTGRSTMHAKVLAAVTGSLAVVGTDNASLAGLVNGSAFQIKSSVANVNTTITIVTNQTPAQLLALLNAVPGISASIDATTHFLTVTATDGGSVVLTDGANTPLASSNLLQTAGTYTPTVAANAGMVKVIKVTDPLNNVLEVVLVNQSRRDNGAD